MQGEYDKYFIHSFLTSWGFTAQNTVMALNNQTVGYSNNSALLEDELFLKGTLGTCFIRNSKQVSAC